MLDRSNPVRNRMRHDLLLRAPLVLRPLPLRAHKLLYALCQQAIVDLFLVRFRAVRVPVARAPVNPCVRNIPAKDKGKVVVHSPRVLVALAVKVDLVVRIGLLVNGLVQLRLVRVPARALPVVPRCCRHFQFQSGCRRRLNPASLCTLAGLRNVSVPWRTSARWKASASSILRASVPVLVAALPLRSSLRRSRVLPAK